jgi:hypothetical protein
MSRISVPSQQIGLGSVRGISTPSVPSPGGSGLAAALQDVGQGLSAFGSAMLKARNAREQIRNDTLSMDAIAQAEDAAAQAPIGYEESVYEQQVEERLSQIRDIKIASLREDAIERFEFNAKRGLIRVRRMAVDRLSKDVMAGLDTQAERLRDDLESGRTTNMDMLLAEYDGSLQTAEKGGFLTPSQREKMLEQFRNSLEVTEEQSANEMISAYRTMGIAAERTLDGDMLDNLINSASGLPGPRAKALVAELESRAKVVASHRTSLMKALGIWNAPISDFNRDLFPRDTSTLNNLYIHQIGQGYDRVSFIGQVMDRGMSVTEFPALVDDIIAEFEKPDGLASGIEMLEKIAVYGANAERTASQLASRAGLVPKYTFRSLRTARSAQDRQEIIAAFTSERAQTWTKLSDELLSNLESEDDVGVKPVTAYDVMSERGQFPISGVLPRFVMPWGTLSIEPTAWKDVRLSPDQVSAFDARFVYRFIQAREATTAASTEEAHVQARDIAADRAANDFVFGNMPILANGAIYYMPKQGVFLEAPFPSSFNAALLNAEQNEPSLMLDPSKAFEWKEDGYIPSIDNGTVNAVLRWDGETAKIITPDHRDWRPLLNMSTGRIAPEEYGMPRPHLRWRSVYGNSPSECDQKFPFLHMSERIANSVMSDLEDFYGEMLDPMDQEERRIIEEYTRMLMRRHGWPTEAPAAESSE